MKKMYDFFRLPTYQHLCAVGGFLACLLFGFQVNAQTIAASDAAFQRFMWSTTGANTQTVGFSAGGTPVISPSSTGSLGSDGGKSLPYSNDAQWSNGSGNKVNGTVSGRVSVNAKTAKILTAGLKALPGLSAGYAIYDLVRDLGFDATKDAAGDVSITKTPLPYTWFIPGAAPSSRWTNGWASASALCTAFWIDNNPLRQPLITTCTGNGNGSTCGCLAGPGSSNDITVERRAVTPGAGVASTLQELEDKIASESGWPVASRLPAALVDAAVRTGQRLEVEAPKITGPATSPGTVKTTTSPTTTTTTTTNHGHTYNDNRVTNNITTSVNVTNNQTGTGETTTTTEEPVEEQTECEKNPDSIGCAELDTPDDEIPKTEKQVSFTPENLGFGGGSCPANVVMTPANMATPIMVINWADNCQKITTYAKPMILAMALFAAMMIIFVGKTE